MILKALTISNIRSFRTRQRIEFNDDINIFIGKNGSGKSTILNTIKLLGNYLMISHSPYLKSLEEITFKKNDRNRPYEISCEVFFSSNFIDSIPIKENENSQKSKIPVLLQKIYDKIKKLCPSDGITLCLNYNLGQKVLNPDTANSQIFTLLLRYFRIKHSPQYAEFIGSYFNGNWHTSTQFIELPMPSPIFALKNERCLFQYDIPNGRMINKDAVKIKNMMIYNAFSVGQMEGIIKILGEYSRSSLLTAKESEFLRHFENLTSPNQAVSIFSIDNPPKAVPLPIGMNNVFGKDSTLDKNISKIEFQASSDGEKQLLGFQALHGFDLKHSLILMDEPETSIHLQEQEEILKKIKALMLHYNNEIQFFISTHSPIFITQKNISKTFRVFIDSSKSSKIVAAQKYDISQHPISDLLKLDFKGKALFADKIVLVEGKADKAFFDILIDYENKSTSVIEVIDVDGKHNFTRYKDLLQYLNFNLSACFIIADFDYLKTVGTQDVKQILNTGSISLDKVKNQRKSNDVNKLHGLFNKYIANTDDSLAQDIEKAWNYCVERWKSSIHISELSDSDREILKNNCIALSEDNIFILQHGTLEDYLLKLEHRPMDQGKATAVMIKGYSSQIIDFFEKNSNLDISRDLKNIIDKICL